MEQYIKTTMIGSIHAMEKKFEEELKNEEFKEKFSELRKDILDLGNGQIRLFRKDRDEKRN